MPDGIAATQNLIRQVPSKRNSGRWVRVMKDYLHPGDIDQTPRPLPCPPRPLPPASLTPAGPLSETSQSQ